MISIRKFVGYTGAAAGISAAIALAASAQIGLAYAPSSQSSDRSIATQATVSAECAAAVQNIKSAATADASEDASERAVAKTNPDLAGDQTEDSTERANFVSLFGAARTACAPATTSAPLSKTFTPSAQCTSAVQALKAAWAAGRPTTRAQWMQLQTMAQAVRAACGWTEGR
ncbi:MAG: hypothetical protein E6H86_05300 [Chloroflexi bacterium]|nr:MAG: hypothetical protein E6H86_05300 [Chloroflexota bacterium]